MKTVVVAALLLIVTATLAPATVVILNNDVKLEGEIVNPTRDGFKIRIPLGNDASGNSVARPIRWTSVKSMDGLSVADWIREQGVETESVEIDPAVVDIVIWSKKFEEQKSAWTKKC